MLFAMKAGFLGIRKKLFVFRFLAPYRLLGSWYYCQARTHGVLRPLTVTWPDTQAAYQAFSVSLNWTKLTECFRLKNFKEMIVEFYVFTWKMGDYLWDLFRKAVSSSRLSNKRCHETPHGVGTNDTFTPGELGLVATVTMSRGEISLVIMLNISMGGMWHCDWAHDMCHASRLSVILMSSVIQINDDCDTPPYTNRNHSHHKPTPRP